MAVEDGTDNLTRQLEENTRPWLNTIRKVKRQVGPEGEYPNYMLLSLITKESSGDERPFNDGPVDSSPTGLLQVSEVYENRAKNYGYSEPSSMNVSNPRLSGEESIRMFYHHMDSYQSTHENKPSVIVLLHGAGYVIARDYKNKLEELRSVDAADSWLQENYINSYVYLTEYRKVASQWADKLGTEKTAPQNQRRDIVKGDSPELFFVPGGDEQSFELIAQEAGIPFDPNESFTGGLVKRGSFFPSVFSPNVSEEILNKFANASECFDNVQLAEDTVATQNDDGSYQASVSETPAQKRTDEIATQMKAYASSRLDESLRRFVANRKYKATNNFGISDKLAKRYVKAYNSAGDFLKSFKLIQNKETLQRRVVWPLETIEVLDGSGPFGASRGGGSIHLGVDLVTGDIGTAQVTQPVYAVMDGVVRVANDGSTGGVSGYGKIIYLAHKKGVTTRYAHLSEVNVEVGQEVSKGQIIGQTGRSDTEKNKLLVNEISEPHLHFEFRFNTGMVRTGNIAGGASSHLNEYTMAVDPMIFFRDTVGPTGERLAENKKEFQDASQQFSDLYQRTSDLDLKTVYLEQYDDVQATKRSREYAEADRADFYREEASRDES